MAKAYLKTSKGNIQLIDGTSCPLNFGIADIRDLEARGGTFSKQLNAVWNDENHRILGQLFNVNTTNSLFDFNKRVECQVVEDGIIIVDNAYLQLIEINEEQTTNQEQQVGSYSILVKSAQRDLFTKMGADELTDLDFSYLNHTYTSANVATSFTHNVADGYTYPMGINDNNEFLLTDFRPAIYVNEYFKQIHARAGYSFEVVDWDIFNKLIIPFNGNKPLVDNTNFDVVATKSSFSSSSSEITSWTEVTDNEGIFNPTTGVYDVPVYLTGGQNINVNVAIDFDLVLDNQSGANAYLVDLLNSGFDRSLRYRGNFLIYKNGAPYLGGNFIAPLFGANQGFEVFESDTPIANGDNVILSTSTVINLPAGNLLPTDELTFVITPQVAAGNALVSSIAWKDAASSTANNVTVEPRIDVNDVTVTLQLTANTIGFNYELDMNQFVPDKIKQKDFVKAICNMAQLMAFPDPNNPNKIIYQPRDKWIDEGVEKDWSEKLLKDQNQLIKFLPELSGKRRIFTYKPDDDVYNAEYVNAVNEVYGQAEYIFETEFQTNTDRLELIFSPTPMVENSVGAIVPAYIGVTPDVNIRILIHNGVETCNPYNIYDFATTGQTGLTTYAICSHFDKNFNPTVDINFAVCDYYYYQGINLTNNNLYNLWWRRTMSQINNGKMLTAMFDLDFRDIAALNLNDKIYVKGAWWNINRVIDYDANSDRPTKVELISVDDGISLPPFRVKPVRPVFPPYQEPIEKLYRENNINYSEGSMKVVGKNNIVNAGLRGMVIGDFQFIEEDGFINTEPVLTNNESDNILWKIVKISQSGTSSPTYTEVINNTGETITVSRTGVGTYVFSGFDGQLSGNVEIFYNGNQIEAGESVEIFSATGTDNFVLRTFDDTNALADGVLTPDGAVFFYGSITIKKYT